MRRPIMSALFVSLVAFAIGWNGSAKAQNIEHFKFLDKVQCVKNEDEETCEAKQAKYKELCEKADGITTYAWRGFTKIPH